jgi:iduronate 2-sulfatase
MGYSIRSDRWRYTEWIDRKSGKVAYRELYDHARGPVADRNLADVPEHAATVKRLSGILDGGKGWRKCRKP